MATELLRSDTESSIIADEEGRSIDNSGVVYHGQKPQFVHIPTVEVVSNIKSPALLHSCSEYKFYHSISSCPLHQDVLALISKYYSPTPTLKKTVENRIIKSVGSTLLRYTNVPIPSWHLAKADYRKRHPTQCPELSTHLTLEFLVWVMVLVCVVMGRDNWSSFLIIAAFYVIIQFLLQCIAYCYIGIHRYKRIASVPLYDDEMRLTYFGDVFDKEPLVSMNLSIVESMASIAPNIHYQHLFISECAVFLEFDANDHQFDDGWFYCIEYETEIDFVDRPNRKRFERACIDFINRKWDRHCEYASFEVKVVQRMLEDYNRRYWNGSIMIMNTRSKWALFALRCIIQLLNILCLSLLYKVPLYFVPRKRLKVIKYIGFDEEQ